MLSPLTIEVAEVIQRSTFILISFGQLDGWNQATVAHRIANVEHLKFEDGATEVDHEAAND